jgi:DNA adenine methylase
MCSFGGKWWGGYATNSAGRNYAERGSRCLVKQVANLMDVEFINLNYLDMAIPQNSLIYCDPPYFGVTGYDDPR